MRAEFESKPPNQPRESPCPPDVMSTFGNLLTGLPPTKKESQMSEKTSDQHLEDLGDLEATELNDSDLESVAGGRELAPGDNNENCGCNGQPDSGGSNNNNCGC